MISESHRETLKQTHAASPGWGATRPEKWLAIVTAGARALGAHSILDYGCGKGLLADALGEIGYDVRRYDPATFPQRPAPADLVICLDVLEHVEPEHVMSVLGDIEALAGRGAFLVISLRPAVKVLPDGRNAHLTIWSREDWLAALSRVFALIEPLPSPHSDRELCVTVRGVSHPP